MFVGGSDGSILTTNLVCRVCFGLFYAAQVCWFVCFSRIVSNDTRYVRYGRLFLFSGEDMLWPGEGAVSVFLSVYRRVGWIESWQSIFCVAFMLFFVTL